MTGLMQPIDRTDKFVYQIVNILVARYLMRKIKKKTCLVLISIDVDDLRHLLR